MAESNEDMTFKADASMSGSSEVVSDDIYHVNEAMNEKRKNFFDRLFS
ncbi:Putative PAS/PAC sensor protein (fragment) [Capnocytophaga canimorsus]